MSVRNTPATGPVGPGRPASQPRRNGGEDPAPTQVSEPSEEEFAASVVVLADEPDDAEDGIRITRTELQMCAAAPLRLMVIMHWRYREQDGRPRTAGAVWAALTEQGIYSDDGVTPVSLTEVTDAVAFLLDQGVITAPAGGAL